MRLASWLMLIGNAALLRLPPFKRLFD